MWQRGNKGYSILLVMFTQYYCSALTEKIKPLQLGGFFAVGNKISLKSEEVSSGTLATALSSGVPGNGKLAKYF